ncbi:uncharacterized protein EI97DRAFT_430123 [Westerdykella ornata]|uniref:BTB domain-containing protein n=1 Tax=Westerdykella ornata TaxID=318751 RepID=A0A6A6JVX7_WESOR|nr:uncharacterized protein EI97DRAFT_430123 [Westerdykella ornata]KAF2280385.1 hypothetical protein EI97DRAFT_430123 [Westerdykella ornata]
MPEIPEEKPLNELLSRSLVDVYVGPENTHWVLHEKLLCYHSPFFRNIFYSKTNPTTSYGLPEEEVYTFRVFVGWLYSGTVPVPKEEDDLSILYDLYLLAEKLQIPSLIQAILHTVREWYKYTETYPGLRRVQYIYANTEHDSPMRHMLVHSVARMLVLSEDIPQHWDKALKKNGQLAVDLIRAMQEWRLDEAVVPDAREDPSEVGDLMDDEVGSLVERRQQGAGDRVEEDGPHEEMDHDSNEDTVVESPTATFPAVEIKSQGIHLRSKEPEQGAQKDQSRNDIRLSLNEVPNQVSLDDYGTLH